MKYLTPTAVLGAACMFSALGLAQDGMLKQQMSLHPAYTAAASSPTTSPATTGPDVYRVNYFRNANTAGYASNVIDIVDPGTNGSGNLCADIYVVTPDEELAECCGCKLTPDQLIEISVNGNLTQNAATGGVVHNGVIKIISSTPTASGTCNAGAPVPTPSLREWITHDTNLTGTHHPTEVEFSNPDLSTAEESSLAGTCAFFQSHLSGHGICTCPGLLPN